MIIYWARHVVPVASPPISSGAVAVQDGLIVAVGRKRDVQKAAGPDAQTQDLGDVVLVPGLVNAHTHVEMSWMAAAPPAASDYVGWVREIVARRGGVEEGTAREAAEEAVRALVSRGTAAVGDVSNDLWVAAVLARSPLAAVVFHEILGFRSAEAERIVDHAAARLESIAGEPDVRAAGPRIVLTLTPHGAHSTSPALLKALGGRATAAQEPLSIHVAESEAEVELLARGTGPMVDFLRERGVWDDGWRAGGHSPVDYLDRLGVLTPRTLAVHCVHVGQQDLSRLQARGVTVVACPRSNARLGVGKAPVPRILASGIPVALGTDSTASAPDLDLFAEMAALRTDHPALAPATVLRMATLNGARALGFSRDLGSLEPGKRGVIVEVPLEDPEDDPLETVTSSPPNVGVRS
jgi:cytosine/adenosine deaminase-related metal-dependent hydrolase